MLRHNICSGIARKKCYSYQKNTNLRCWEFESPFAHQKVWRRLGTSSSPENKISYTPPPGKLSRSRQYRVNQFKLFKSMYPWFWSLSLISLSLSLFFSLCYTYQFICPYKISYSSKQISYMCSSKQISYSYDEIRTSSEQAYFFQKNNSLSKNIYRPWTVLLHQLNGLVRYAL